MQEKGKAVFDVEESAIFRTVLTVSRDGYYSVEIGYGHQNWDAWGKLNVVGESGKTFTCIPPLPRKYTKTTILVYLFAGRNHISMAPRFDQPVRIRDVALCQEAPRLLLQVIPSRDWFYLDSPRPRRLTVISYTGAPLKITAGDREVPFELENKALYDHADPVETKEPPAYYHLRLSPGVLNRLGEGEHLLTIHLPEDHSVSYHLNGKLNRGSFDLQIVNLDVNHGNCVLLRLPNGKNLLIDTGTENCAGDVIVPYLQDHGIGIDYLLISHFHEDHMGGLEQLLDRYALEKPDGAEVRQYIRQKAHGRRMEYLSRFGYLDSSLLCRYDRLEEIWDLGGVEIRVLNSKYERDGEEVMAGIRDENETSVSMLVSYKGFRYYHGSDNYASVQQRNLKDFAEAGMLQELQCQYMQANHHFHGDLLPEMIRAINPVAVVIPANQTIFSRSAYMVDYVQGVENSDYPDKRLKDTFVSYLSGTVCALVNSGEDWHYETY